MGKILNKDIDFENISSVTLDWVVPSYRTETQEEFDVLTSDYLTALDGWQHYETEPVEHEVEKGNDYCFTIRYKDGTELRRKFHETSPLSQKLLAIYVRCESSGDTLTFKSYGNTFED